MVNQQSVKIFKYFIIFLKIWTGQLLLTVSLSKIQTEPQKYFILFNKTNNI